MDAGRINADGRAAGEEVKSVASCQLSVCALYFVICALKISEGRF
jgi:hypothetical protein